VYFDERDVVRHKLVQAIVKAYEAYGNGEASPRARARAVGAGPSTSRGD
jgi:phosphate starvation-inducible protein PhoH